MRGARLRAAQRAPARVRSGLVGVLITCALPLGAQQAHVIDDFSSLAVWTSAPSDGVSLRLVPAAGAMRMDVDFHGGGGYAVARPAREVRFEY